MKDLIVLSYSYAIAFCVGLLSYPAQADSSAPPHPVFTASENGRYLFKMIPARWPREAEQQKKSANDFGVAYRVGANGELTEVWKVSGWFAFRMFLSDDGEHLVRMGPWSVGREPKKGDLAVAFYKHGELLKEYSTADLVEDKSAVPTTVTHYTWLACFASAGTGQTPDIG